MSVFKFRNIDDNTDYMAKMNEAAAKGDLAAAEGYERDRNYKIDKLGLNVPKTFNYIDVGNEIKAGMQNGAPGSYIKELDDYRVNKANTTPGLGDFSNDEIHEAALRYQANDLMGVGGQFENRPVYNDKYGAAVDEMWNRIMNGEEFSYDVESDPSFQSYRDMYIREGNRAMQDTLAQVAQNAGGNNSYAVSAAAQANNYYMQQLMDKVPELYDAAYNRYVNEENLKRQDFEMARMLQSDDYNRYLGDMGVFQTNVGLADDMVNSQLAREYQDRQWKYGEEWDNKKWDYEVAQAEKANALSQINTLISMGQEPKAELFAKAGITDIQGYLAMAQIYGTEIANSQYAANLDNEYQMLKNRELAYDLGLLGTNGSAVGYQGGTADSGFMDKAMEMMKFKENRFDADNLAEYGLENKTYRELEEILEGDDWEVTPMGNGKVHIEKIR